MYKIYIYKVVYTFSLYIYYSLLPLKFHLELQNWIACHRCNSTFVSTIPGHLHVSFFSPLRIPGVLDDPVVLSILSAVSYDQHTMIQIFCVTCLSREDT